MSDLIERKQYDAQFQDSENDEDLVECCRCETQELAENMTDTDMGYLCECCHGDLF